MVPTPRPAAHRPPSAPLAAPRRAALPVGRLAPPISIRLLVAAWCALWCAGCLPTAGDPGVRSDRTPALPVGWTEAPEGPDTDRQASESAAGEVVGAGARPARGAGAKASGEDGTATAERPAETADPAESDAEADTEVEGLEAQDRRGPQNFRVAKKVALKRVYFDHRLTFYCQVPFEIEVVKGRERMVLAEDPTRYRPRKPLTKKGKPNIRTTRIEWEHLAPAHSLGQHLPCWREGGRKACGKDPDFRRMESDLYNLVPAVGEVNADRSNFRYAESSIGHLEGQYGPCPMGVDFKERRAFPPPDAKGEIARAYLYMSETYGIRLSDQEARLMGVWHRRVPPSDWERQRAERIEAIQGTRNRFVWGEGPPPR